MNQKTHGKGLALRWSTSAISLYVSWAVAGYYTFFCTDVLGLNAAVIGTLFLVSKIIDAVSNFVIAYIIDNTHSKWGKGRPYEISIIPMWVCVVLLFSISPSWGMTAKYVMVFLYYTLINAVFGTFLTCIDSIYLKHAITEETTRNNVQAFRGGASMIAMMAATILMPILVARFSEIPHGWTILALIIAVPMAIIGSIRFLTIPELDAAETMEETTHVTIKDTLTAFLTNKYTLIIMIMYFTINLLNSFNTTPATYYFKYIIGDISKQSLVSLMSVAAVASLFICVPLANKFGRVKILKVTFFISAVGCLLRFLAGTSVPFLMGASLISSIVTYPFSAFGALMLIDSMDYGEWKNGKKVEGAIFAGSSLGSTIGAGVGASLCGIVLNVFGYNGLAEVQTARAIFGIRFCYAFIPAILLVVVVIVLGFYDLEGRMPQIHKELEERKGTVQAEEV